MVKTLSQTHTDEAHLTDSRIEGTTRLQNPPLSGIKNKVITSKPVITIIMLAIMSKLMASNMHLCALWLGDLSVCSCAVTVVS